MTGCFFSDSSTEIVSERQQCLKRGYVTAQVNFQYRRTQLMSGVGNARWDERPPHQAGQHW